MRTLNEQKREIGERQQVKAQKHGRNGGEIVRLDGKHDVELKGRPAQQAEGDATDDDVCAGTHERVTGERAREMQTRIEIAFSIHATREESKKCWIAKQD